MSFKLWHSSWELQTWGLLNVLSGSSGGELNLELHPGVSLQSLNIGLLVRRSYSGISIMWQWKAELRLGGGRGDRAQVCILTLGVLAVRGAMGQL